MEELREKRDRMIVAYHTNPNWDEEQNREKRTELIHKLDEDFHEAVRILYAGETEEEGRDAFEEDPLFRPLAQRRKLEAEAPVEMPNEGRGGELDPALRV